LGVRENKLGKRKHTLKTNQTSHSKIPNGACDVSHVWEKSTIDPKNAISRYKHTGKLPWYSVPILPESLELFGLMHSLKKICRDVGKNVNERKLWNLAYQCMDTNGAVCSGISTTYQEDSYGELYAGELSHVYTGDQEYQDSGYTSGEGRCLDVRDEV